MVAALTAQGRAPATVRKAYQLASLILRQAVSDDLISRSPARGIDLPSNRHVESEIRFLSVAEISDLHDAMNPRYRVAVSLGAYASLRLGEALGLRVEDLDLLRRTLTVTHSLNNHSGRVSLRTDQDQGQPPHHHPAADGL
jgi:integrase